MTPFNLDHVLKRATVPEHSAGFMRAMSGGEPFLVGPYLFLAGRGFLLAVGYPLEGEYTPEGFDRAIADALRRTGAGDCWAVCPFLPPRLKVHCRIEDHYYVRPAGLPVPPRLERLAGRSVAVLRVEEGRTFTASHRRLWAEFLHRVPLPPTVCELFARTESVLPKAPGLSLLNAWDREGHLVACLVIDLAPYQFLTYVIGAHSRLHYTAHASDLLFLEMIKIARREGKDYLHLGLGVNEGIRRFKVKWGGRPVLPYELASWEEKRRGRPAGSDLLLALAALPADSSARRELLPPRPPERRFAMLWEVERDGRRSWIAGTAHFFCYSFASSLRRIFEGVDTVLFEGPLDQASLDRVAEIGRTPEPGTPRLVDALSEEDIRLLERVVCGPRGLWARLLGLQSPNPPDVRFFLSKTRPWMAFFSLWTRYLERQGWTQSVDLEAWHLARDMGKELAGMETIAEQIEILESIPIPRILNFFRRCRHWNRYIKQNVRTYLKGDLEGMMGTSTEFPTRTDTVIGHRDACFLDRMQPFLAQGRCAVFVGTAHMFHLREFLAGAGFQIRRCR